MPSELEIELHILWMYYIIHFCTTVSIYTNIEDVEIIYFNHIMRNYVYIDRNVQLQTRIQTRIEVFHLNV